MSVNQSWRNCDQIYCEDFIVKREISEEDLQGEVTRKDKNESGDEEECPIANFVESPPSVTKAPPVALNLKTRKTGRQPRKLKKLTSPAPQLEFRGQFLNEMKNKIIAVINEASMFGIDAREYHPFYLEMLKNITQGQRQGFIGGGEDDVQKLWMEFDDLIQALEKRRLKLEGNDNDYELSPYALYIQQSLESKRGLERQNLNHFRELENTAEKISLKWKLLNGTRHSRDDLEARLEFLKECRTVTNPLNVVKMNDLWKKLREGCKSTCVYLFTSEVGVPDSFQCRVRMEDVAKDGKWGSRVRRLLLKRKLSASQLETQTPSSPNRIERAPKRKKTVQLQRSNRKHSKSKKKVIPTPKVQKRGRGRPRKVDPSEEEIAKKKLQEKRLNKFKRTWSQRRWRLRMICRRRRRWEILRSKRSVKVGLTLEKVLMSSCRLRTLKNRKKWIKMKLLNSEDLSCPYCKKIYKTYRSKMIHISRMHPKQFTEQFGDIKSLRRKTNRENAKAARKKFRETGEGPEWVKRKRIRIQTNKTVVCEECGEIVLTSSLNKHRSTVHNPNWVKSRCPTCNQTFVEGGQLWCHFQSVHLNYDFTKLSKAKAAVMGFDIKDDASESGQSGGQRKKKGELQDVSKVVNDVGIEEYMCDLCGKTFEQPEIATRHLKNVHGLGKKEWRCDICSKTFRAKDVRDAHVRQIHEGQDYRCDICNRKLQSKGKLWRHKVEVHHMKDLEPPEGVNVSVCPYCGETILRGMLAHVKKHHPEKQTEYLQIKKAEGKTKSKSGDVRFNPRSKKARLNYNLKRREQTRKWREEGICDSSWIAATARPKNNCPFCGMSMSIIKRWTEHLDKFCEGKAKATTKIIIKPREKQWICPVGGCEQTFYRSCEMKRHVVIHSDAYGNLEKKKYVSKVETECTNGDFTFKANRYHCLVCKDKDQVIMVNQPEVVLHFLVNHTDLYIQCKGEADPEVGTKVKLVNEEFVHEGRGQNDDKPIEVPMIQMYPCPHCSVELFSDSDLRSHVEVNHEDKCWRCPYPNCTKVILSPEELNNHFKEDHGLQR